MSCVQFKSCTYPGPFGFPKGEQMSKPNANSDNNRLSGDASDGQRSIEPPYVMDERGRTVAWITRTVHRLFDAESQKILDRKKISISHWYYLRVLAERGELNQLELSRRVGFSSTTAVPALDNMEKRGLLKRVRDPKDRRKYYVRLTGKGKMIVDELLPDLLDLMEQTTRNLSADEMRVFWKVMHDIERTMTRHDSLNIVSD
jgi:MarR family transcriptional regulator, organic hydroperoxide resistance regulator